MTRDRDNEVINSPLFGYTPLASLALSCDLALLSEVGRTNQAFLGFYSKILTNVEEDDPCPVGLAADELVSRDHGVCMDFVPCRRWAYVSLTERAVQFDCRMRPPGAWSELDWVIGFCDAVYEGAGT